MKISLDWIGDYVDLVGQAASRELAHQLTLKTVEVEDVVDLAAGLREVVIGRVIATEQLGSGASVVRCTVGRDQQAIVVTRAVNLTPGVAVAVALPGAWVNGREIKPVKVDGVVSEAYLCRAADLGLEKLYPATDSGDALVLDEPDVSAGSPLTDVVLWRDVVLEIDNKSLTNRPDLWGHHGLAREFSAILGLPLAQPVPEPRAPRPTPRSGLVGSVDPTVCRRITLVEFELDIQVTSPLWLRSRLARIGEGSVNLPVDLGNYVMFATGQPVHVYDAERLALPLSVAAQTEPLELEVLDGQRVGLPAGAAVVRDERGPVALAGIMGGRSSAITGESRRFILEAATFAPGAIRRTAQRTGQRTEAAARFEKGLDTQRVDQAVDLYLALLTRCVPGGRVVAMQDHDPDPTPRAEVDVDLDFLTTRIGMPLESASVQGTLEALGFVVRMNGTRLHTIAPTWRSTGDVSIPDDVLEEVARIHGYDEIPAASLGGTFTHLSPNEISPLDRRVREQLAVRFGMQEVLTYPWSAERMLKAAGYNPADGVVLDGAPAADMATLRPSLVPNLLEAISANLRFTRQFSIFEVGAVYDGTSTRPWADRFEPIPTLATRVAAVLVGSDGRELFLQGKGVLETLARACRIVDLRLGRPEDSAATPTWADRHVQLALTADGHRVGTLALLSTRCCRLAGIEGVHVTCFELDLDEITMHMTRENTYRPISEWPESEFDLSVVVPEEILWAQASESARSVGDLVHQVDFVGEFRGSWVPQGSKSMTLRVTLRPQKATLTSEDIASARKEVLTALGRDLGAYLRA
ncbi:phenylalanine--tRNA ligase subunit beta [Frankia sp. Mgl5]|uniref:phenylalanine--tRNA ligase subunit beta n=1 Tax=Frankia sp. Mgl5 TaxID=2933793 RepID=UPI00200F6589|nr:phenylalanine--tRNA ligase subunit beta [Frankia sp. Mgl5]MCK9930732.1 phenylalanine--tRNA ligase subunit beta [Frankia sp. Mgl5]